MINYLIYWLYSLDWELILLIILAVMYAILWGLDNV